MATRSAQNKRTMQKRTGDAAGATRKGASRAKPSKGAATTVRQAPAKGSKGAVTKKAAPLMSKEEKREANRQQRDARNREIVVSNILLEQDPKYKFRRKIWWALLGVGVILTAAAWICMLTTDRYALSLSHPSGVAVTVILICAYVAIIGAFVYDLVRIRPIRKNIDVVVSSTPEKRLQMIIDEDAAARKEAKEAHKALKKAKKHMTKEEKQELKEEKRKVKLARKMYGKDITKAEQDEVHVDEHAEKIRELAADGLAKAEAEKVAREKKRAKAKAAKAKASGKTNKPAAKSAGASKTATKKAAAKKAATKKPATKKAATKKAAAKK